MSPMFLIIFFAVSTLAQENNASGKQNLPEVQLAQGKLIGKYDLSTEGRQFISFLGIPYARPPLGKLRLKDPEPAHPWSGTYNGTSIPNECIQYTHFGYKVIGNEDCLYINVYTPELPKSHSGTNLKDVIVYIHGGAFMFSSGYEYGPQNLMDKDVIFVNFNYRLGPLGFLSTEDEVITGNFGLKDQSMALKWVKNNIAAFGGNPDSITIAGMSAGGVSVHYHMLSHLSKGLFNRAISMSGSALCPWAQAEKSRDKAWHIGRKLNCTLQNSQSLLECLQKQSAEDIVSLSKDFIHWLYMPFTPFGPVVEAVTGGFIDRKPIEIVKEGPVSDVPWLISFTSQEGLYPGTEITCNETNFKFFLKERETLLKYLLDFEFTIPKGDQRLILEKIWKEYMGTNRTSYKTHLIDMLTDRLFVANIVQTGMLQSKAMSSQVYAYEFSYRGKNSASDYFCPSRGNYGVSHADDLGYIIKGSYLNSNETEADIEMKNMMTNLWTSFASSGIPIFNGYSGTWTKVKHGLPKFNFLNVKSTKEIEPISDTNTGNLKFWSSLQLEENNVHTK